MICFTVFTINSYLTTSEYLTCWFCKFGKHCWVLFTAFSQLVVGFSLWVFKHITCASAYCKSQEEPGDLVNSVTSQRIIWRMCAKITKEESKSGSRSMETSILLKDDFFYVKERGAGGGGFLTNIDVCIFSLFIIRLSCPWKSIYVSDEVWDNLWWNLECSSCCW